MTTPEPTDSKMRARKGSLLPVILVSVVLGAALAGAWWYFAPDQNIARKQAADKQVISTPKNNKPVPHSVPSPPSADTGRTADQLQPRQPLATDTGQQQIKQPEKNHAQPVTAETGTTLPLPKDCHQLAERLHSFFTHLDTQPYIKKALSGREAQEYFLGLAHKLLNQPPVVSRETDDLYTMLKNMAHFFRVIGGQNIVLIKTILSRESDTIEDVISDFYAWATGPRCEDPAFPFHPPLEKMYEYAGFFLNSLGGRSYLFRRDSRSRLLVNYYSILVVDLANDKELNRHGIDLRPLIPLAIDEIENTTQLIYRERYLDTLYRLEKKYPRLENDMDTMPILQ